MVCGGSAGGIINEWTDSNEGSEEEEEEEEEEDSTKERK